MSDVTGLDRKGTLHTIFQFVIASEIIIIIVIIMNVLNTYTHNYLVQSKNL
jgi:hypothetical protein